MLERIPTVLTGQEILDKAFSRSLKIDIADPVRYHRIRKTETARMSSVVDTVAQALVRYPMAFPNLEHLRDYEVEVLDILTGLHPLRKSLGSVRWAADKVRDVGRDSMERMAKQRSVDGIKAVQKRCYGRVCSLVYEVDKDLDLLRETREKAKLLPTVAPEYATVVIAGFPNVGKTSLLKAWTGSNADVAGYAFTTKHAEVGHFEVKDGLDPRRIQVVDTPGLLDRPDEERNDVERQATAALTFAADAVLFLVDPTETSGYSAAKQWALLDDVKKTMVGLPLLVAETKADLWKSDTEHLKFSTQSGEGLDDLKTAVIAMLPKDKEWDDPLDKWRGKSATSEF